MFSKISLRLALAAFLLAAFSSLSMAQVTTASISGSVTDGSAGLSGAIVRALHVPSGTTYGVAVREDGSFTLPNLRIGGPYRVSASYTGFQEKAEEGIVLSLGQKLRLNFELKSASQTTGEVVVTVDPTLNSQRTGSATNISREQIANLPTISRSASDYYRLTPLADGNSFAGRNDQYNGFSLDGAVFNNPFGLDAATPGGQTDAQPISLDAIEQIQVSIAPYDVTQAGFTGAAINTVTKSGTNEFKGTVFGFTRSEGLTGGKVNGNDVFKGDLSQNQAGFALGGPIVKNKIFFFANAEIDRRSDLGSAWKANRGQTDDFVSRVSAADLDAVRAALKSKYGYETGDYENYNLDRASNKALFKLDFNLSDNHKLTTTFNWLDAFKENPAHPSAIGRRGPDATTLQFKNSGYRINNTIYNANIELKSAFGSRFSNKMQVVRTAFRDKRDPFSTAMPVININQNGVRAIVAGHEPFSINNVLDQDTWQINDNFNIYLKKNTITVGAGFEKFAFNNSFNLGAYDAFTYGGGTFGGGFASPQAFVDSVNTGAFDQFFDYAKTSASRADDKWANPETNLGQISAYAQDEIQVTGDLTLTVGIRLDRPEYFDTKEKIREQLDPSRNCCYVPSVEYFDPEEGKRTIDHTVLPDEKVLFSPRFGFNWDAAGDRSLQIRGGSGLFTGRFPFVWIGNQVANPNIYFYCTTDDDFQFPQVWRTNLGADKKFGGGWIASADFIYTKDQNAVIVQNWGLNQPTASLAGSPDTRKIYGAGDRINDAFVVTNTDLGRSVNASLELKRTWAKGLFTSLAYAFTDAKDASSIDAEISSDAFQRNPALGNVNDLSLTNSIYGNRHRVVGSASKKFSYADGKLGTTIGLFMQYARGGRFSYTYSGDLNNDGSFINDLLYVPTDGEIDQMAFSGDAAASRTAFKTYIAQDDYLSSIRGGYAEKGSTLSPWWSSWDLRVLQDLNLKKAGGFQLSFDVLNIGNLLNSDWGVRQTPTNSQPIGVSVAGGAPTYSFDSGLKSTFSADPSLLSRWQAQIGLRYSF